MLFKWAALQHVSFIIAEVTFNATDGKPNGACCT
jgi:hypothetical protein